MGRADACAYRGHQLECTLRLERPFSRKQIVQRFTLDVLHYQKRHGAVDNAVVRDRDDVLMSNGGGGERLLAKACNELWIVADEVRKDDLDRELRLQVGVPRFINDAHASLTETAFNVVLALEHRLARDGMHGRHSILWASCYLVPVAILTELAFLHCAFWSKRRVKNVKFFLRPTGCVSSKAREDSSFFTRFRQGNRDPGLLHEKAGPRCPPTSIPRPRALRRSVMSVADLLFARHPLL